MQLDCPTAYHPASSDMFICPDERRFFFFIDALHFPPTLLPLLASKRSTVIVWHGVVLLYTMCDCCNSSSSVAAEFNDAWRSPISPANLPLARSVLSLSARLRSATDRCHRITDAEIKSGARFAGYNHRHVAVDGVVSPTQHCTTLTGYKLPGVVSKSFRCQSYTQTCLRHLLVYGIFVNMLSSYYICNIFSLDVYEQ